MSAESREYRYVIEEAVGVVEGAPDNAVCWRVWDSVAEFGVTEWTTRRADAAFMCEQIREDLELEGGA